MSYTIDVYRGEAKAQKNILHFGAYVTLFPQLIAGPIVRYQTVADELEHREGSADLFASGVKRFACGMGKKVLLANNIGLLWEAASAQTDPTVLTAWLGVIAYGFQIYFDFSGYSDMAIGLGRMLGFRFLENFNYPFLADSITDFWRRWHISMGTWFRDYVYIPLGGNKGGLAKQLRNIAIVWLLTGFWHGASWNFVLWGVYFGVLLVAEKLFLLRWLKKLPAALRHLYAPGQDAAPQHGQHQRIVQRFLHGGEHIPDRCVHGRQRQRKHDLAFPAQPRGQGEKRPTCRDEQQVAPEERILPAQQQPGQRVDEEHRRAPGRVGAHLGVGLVEAEVSLRCAVPHSGGQLLAINDLVAPRAGGQENLRDRHFVDGPLVHQQKYQRRSRRAGRLRPAGQAFSVHRTPKLSQ